MVLDSRERLRRCYFNEELDRPAVYSRTGFPARDPSYDKLKAYLSEYSDLKQGWDGALRQHECPVTHRNEPHSEEFLRHITTLHTPAGTLESTRFVSLQGKPGMSESYFIKSREDADKYLSLPLPSPQSDVASFFEADREMGPRGIVDVSLGSNPAGFVAEVLLGSETFAIFSLTDRDIIHALCERRLQVMIERVRFLLAEGVGPYFSMSGEEFVAPPLHGPEDFYDFNVRYNKPIIDLIHEAGGRVHIHCHGSVKKVFEGFIDMGADVLHPIEPPPLGDMTAAEAKAQAKGRLCIEGNIQIAHMYERTPQQIREEVEALIADAFADRRGLIVSPTASPYIRDSGEQCFPQYKAMVEAVLTWRGKEP